MTSNVCGWFAVDDASRTCVRGAGHSGAFQVTGYVVHEDAEGNKWTYHEDMVGVDEDGGEVWEMWDEPYEEEEK